MNALEIRDLTKHYTGFSLNHLNLTLPWGCIMGLVGENGAGKSTTIKLILNTISRDGGTVTILGRDNRENLCLSKEEIGVVLDEVGISACLTARQVGKIMQGIYRSWDEAVFSDYLTRLAVPADKKFKDFSRGMKMKLGIAVALSHHPRLLILDEATSALDNESEILVGQSLEKLAHGRTTLTIAHRLTTIKDYDRILVLGEEGIVEEGTHAQLLEKQGIYYRLWNQLPGEDTL